MTREEEIIQASEIFSTNDLLSFGGACEELDYGFREGAKWADKNPINVWHDASEEPVCGKRLLLLHTNSVVSIFEYTGKRSWSMLVSCGICQYAYINDLLPKGGEL